MSVDREMAKKVVDYLNQFIVEEPLANCNERIADHPSVQVKKSGSGFTVGLIGLLNGLCGADDDGNGLIVAVSDSETGSIL